jgi:pimeloyl-ACP methyl ester carboxylesterase
VFITGWVTNVDMYWDEPSAIRYLDRLGEIGRVFLIDKRGSGVSDGPTRGYIDPVEDTIDDVRTVLDANGSEESCSRSCGRRAMWPSVPAWKSAP